MKTLALVAIAFAAFLLSPHVHAQAACPPGTVPYSSSPTVSSCGPAPTQQPQAPVVTWESRWGAIAADGPKGILGTASNVLSKKQAVSTALSDCKAKGGVDCIIQVSYSNACGVMIVGDKGYNTEWAPTLQEATDKAMSVCSQHDANCQVYYSDCSLAKRIQQ